MRDRERAEEERKMMLHLWKETSFWAQDLASSITAPGSRAEIRSRCKGKGENVLHQVRPESGTGGAPDLRGHLQEELWGGRGDTTGAATPSPGDADGGRAAEANRQSVLFLLQTRTMFPV